MIFRELELPGAWVLELEPREDERGFFARVWCRDELRARGLETDVVQCNLSYNHKKGTLRGLHYQAAPHEETKLLRCNRGSIYDVVVDLRHDSPTYMRWVSIELSAANGRMLYVPRGFAHGYQTLEDDTETLYWVTASYVPEAERGIRWDDPAFAIEWPEAGDRIISQKDAAWPDFASRENAGSPRAAGEAPAGIL